MADLHEMGSLIHPRIPTRSIRIPDELWFAVQEKALREDIQISTLVRGLLVQWLSAASDTTPPSRARRTS